MKKYFAAIAAALSIVSSAQANNLGIDFNKTETNALLALVQDDIDGFYRGGNSIIGDYIKEEKGIDLIYIDPITYNQEYKKNEIRANKQYKGKDLFITNCYVKSVTAAFDDSPVITCHSNSFLDVQLHFDDTDEAIEDASSISTGMQLDFVCKGGGEVGGIPIGEDCQTANRFTKPYMKKAFIDAIKSRNDEGNLIILMTIKLVTSMTPEEINQCNSNCYSLFKQKGREIFARNDSSDIKEKFKSRLEELGISKEIEQWIAKQNKNK